MICKRQVKYFSNYLEMVSLIALSWPCCCAHDGQEYACYLPRPFNKFIRGGERGGVGLTGALPVYY